MDVRKPLREFTECGLPHALDVVGERWSFLILRAAFNGLVHFEEFSSELGIARNILSNRLSKLVGHEVLARTHCDHDRRKIEYRLTEKGVALLPAMLALRQWGERYAGDIDTRLVLVDVHDSLPVNQVAIQSHDGRNLEWKDLAWQEADKLGQPVEKNDGHATTENA